MDSERNIRASTVPAGSWSLRRCQARSALACSCPELAPGNQKSELLRAASTARPYKLLHGIPPWHAEEQAGFPRCFPPLQAASSGRGTCVTPPSPPATFHRFGRGPALQSEGICLSSKLHMLRWLSSISSLKTLPARSKTLCRVSLLSLLYVLD